MKTQGNSGYSPSRAWNSIPGKPEYVAAGATQAEAQAAIGITPSDASAVAASLTQVAATRALASYGQSDGATPHRCVVYTNSARQSPAGLPVVEYAIDVVGYTNPAGLRFVFHAASAASQPTDQTWATTVGVSAGGFLFVSATGGSHPADSRTFLDTVLFATRIPAGMRSRLLITINSGTGNPVVRLAGADISSSFAIAYGSGGVGTAPPWLSPSLVGTTMGHAYVVPAGEIPAVTPIIGSLSTAERTEYFATGRLPAWVSAGGSAVNRITGNDYSFATVGNWTALNTLTRMADVANAELDCSGISNGAANLAASVFDETWGKGGKFRLQLTLRNVVLDTGATLSIRHGSLNTVILSGITGDTVIDETLVPTAGSSGFYIQINGGAGTSTFSIYQPKVTRLGATTIPAYQATGTVRDLSTLGGTQPNQGRSVGVRPVLAQPSPVNISVFPLSTTGAFLTLASTNPLAFTPQRIVRAEVIVDTAGADLTFRNNSSSTNDIVTALTDIPSANTATALTLIAAQTRLAPNATVWGSLSAGTGFLIVETCDSL